ncbi:MAG: tetratricopeptide repeat protein [Planctomycetota bacterium]
MDAVIVNAIFSVLLCFGAFSLFRFSILPRSLTHRATRALERHQYDRALALYRRLGAAVERRSKGKLRQTTQFVSYQGQGLAFQALNEYSDAIRCFEKARERLAEESVEMPRSVHAQVDCWLTVAYFALGQHGEGEQALRRLNALCDQLDEHDVGPTMELLREGAGLASMTNLLPLAADLLNLVLRKLRNAHESHSALIASTEIRLAEVYMVNGDYPMSVEIIERTLDEGQLDDDQAVNARASLGNALIVLGEIRRSIECLREVCDSRRETNGDHSVAITESSLGVYLRVYGDYAQSERIGASAQRRLSRLSPEDSFLVRTGYVQWIPSLMHRGDYAEADSLLQKLESVPESVATHQGNLLASTFLWRGIYYLRLFRPSLAVMHSREALEVAGQNYGSPQHQQTCDYRIILASALIANDSMREAEEQVRFVEENYASRSFVGPLSLGDFLLVKCELAIAMGDFETARQHARAGLDQLVDRLLPRSVLLAELKTLKARALVGLTRYDDAQALLAEASRIRRQSQPEDHPAFARLYEASSKVFRATGDDARCEDFHRKANAIRDQWEQFHTERKKLGEDDRVWEQNPYSVTTS